MISISPQNPLWPAVESVIGSRYERGSRVCKAFRFFAGIVKIRKRRIGSRLIGLCDSGGRDLLRLVADTSKTQAWLPRCLRVAQSGSSASGQKQKIIYLLHVRLVL